jgi:hypothetical protein
MSHWNISRRINSWPHGKIHIALLGEKLRGGFTLIKIARRSTNSSRREEMTGC